MDLLLLHNEQPVRGNQPRRSLNPITVLLAVAAWERFVVDIRALSALSAKPWQGPGLDRQLQGAAHLANAVPVLAIASGGLLPATWHIRVYRGWRGKTPTNPVLLAGADATGALNGELSEAVADYVKLRHSVAHRAYAQHAYPGSWWDGDAASDTVQAGAARSALAIFLQLIDQSIEAICAALQASGRSVDPQLASLPAWWFRTNPPSGVRGVAAPGQLWGRADLHRLNI
ncbi:hypothetical protein [Geodermatophilus sp. SYSU D00700]